MTDPTDRRAESARAPLVRAAAQQFAHKPYSLVNLDDVVAAVDVTRGAMYFHFPSKQALATAVIAEADKLGREDSQFCYGTARYRKSGFRHLRDQRELPRLPSSWRDCEEWYPRTLITS